jgi:hypothetical protein
MYDHGRCRCRVDHHFRRRHNVNSHRDARWNCDTAYVPRASSAGACHMPVTSNDPARGLAICVQHRNWDRDTYGDLFVGALTTLDCDSRVAAANRNLTMGWNCLLVETGTQIR